MALDYFYDEQIRRYLQQITRVFSNFQIYHGKDKHGNDTFYRVPCIYGDSDRMVQHIKRGNSENTLMPAPFLAVYDTDLIPDRDRAQPVNHVSKIRLSEQQFDEETQSYTGEPGRNYTVERLMPVPYKMTVNVDMWVTQTDHKFQIAEQIMTIFNDDLDIQTSTNKADWTALTVLKLINISWNNRGVPVGVDDNMQISTFTFEIPIWINPPVKLKRQNIINQIVTDLYAASELADLNTNISDSIEGLLNITPENLGLIFADDNFLDRVIVTPNFHYVGVEGTVITLLGPDQGELDANGDIYSWSDLFAEYGELQDNLSLLQLRPGTDIENSDFDFIGRISQHTEANKLNWNIDLETIPTNTLDPVDAYIDPTASIPGDNNIGTPYNGMRLLISEEIGPSAAWGNITASANDIIEFTGAVWSVDFDASVSTTDQNTFNNYSNKYLKFNNTTKEWIIIPDGNWGPGFWRLNL